MAERLAGTVSSGGRPIPGAALTASQGARQVATTSDESGQYLFEDLAAGTWTVEVQMFGFLTARREAGAPGTLDFALELQPRAAAATPASGPARGPAPPNGFQNVLLGQSVETQVAATLSAGPAAVDASASDSNESFLVSGSLSQGLAPVREDDAFEQRRMEFAQRIAGSGLAGGGGFPGGEGGDGGGSPGFGPGRAPGLAGGSPPGGFGGFGGGGGFGTGPGLGGPRGPGGRGSGDRAGPGGPGGRGASGAGLGESGGSGSGDRARPGPAGPGGPGEPGAGPGLGESGGPGGRGGSGDRARLGGPGGRGASGESSGPGPGDRARLVGPAGTGGPGESATGPGLGKRGSPGGPGDRSRAAAPDGLGEGRGGGVGRAGRGPGGGREGRAGVDRGRGFPARPEWANFGNRRNRGREGIRGAAFFSLRNSALDARPYSLTGQTVEKPSYAQSRFGLVGGGLLRIPKIISSERTFFFANYTGTRSRNPFHAVATLPTLAERAGDFSASAAAIFDPATGLPFAAGRVPPTRFSPQAAGLLDFIPLANQPGSVQNYQYVTSVPQNSDNLGLRLTHTLSRRDNIQLNLNLQSRSAENAQLYGFRDETDGRGQSWNLAWTRNLGPRRIHRLGFNFSRNRSQTLPFFAFGADVAARLGIGGVSNEPINFGPPNLSFTNFGGLSDASPVLRRDQTSAVTDSITVVRGRHNLTFGGEFRRMQLNTRTDQNARGTFSFSGLATSAFDPQGRPLAGTGYDFADFLLGLPQSSSVRFGSANTYFRASAYSGFGQDDWRARPNLTLNLGLRYEFFTPFQEKFGRIANLDVAPGFTGVAVVTPGASGPYSGAFAKALIDPDKNNWSPRLGLAWRPIPNRRLQVRGGYGLFFNGSIYNQFPQRLASQPPFASTASLTTSLARPLTLADGFAAGPSQTITNTYAVDRRYRVGYAQTWSLSVEQDLPRSLVLEAGYLGTKGTRLDIQRLPNRATPGSPLTAEQRRQIGNAVGFTFDSSEGNSIYHAGQLRLTRRFRRGISANALYTWSKSLDNASTFGGGGAVVAQNDRDLAAERGLSSFDQRHTLSLFYIVGSPVGSNGFLLRNGGWITRLFEDWNITGALTAGSGAPFTARVLGNLANSGGTGSIGSGRAEATGLAVDQGAGFFNPGAFTLPPAARFGNAGRNTIPGPGSVSLNLSLGRSFRLGEERRRLEFRLESSNFTNHVSYTGLATVVNATNYGLATNTRPMRTFNTTMRYRF